MRITELEPILVSLGEWRNYIFVKVHTDEDIVGIGEAGFSGRAETVAKAIKEHERYLKGKDPRDIERHFQNMYRNTFFRGGPVLMASISAIDIALWDILGKLYDTPVYRLLGGKCRDRVRVYVHLRGETPEELAEDASDKVKEGFTAVRFAPFVKGFEKMRHSRIIEIAVSQVKAVREAVGEDVDICLDVHGRLSPYQAIAMARELEPYRIFFYEDPILPENIDAMAQVARHINLPIATGERLYTIYEFRELINREAVHMVRPDLCLAGGISQCRKIAALAEASYVGVVPHCPLSGVAIAASVHFAASIHNFTLQEYVPFRAEDPIVKTRVKLVRGYLEIPERPGLGVELDESLLSKSSFRPFDLPTLEREDGSVADW
ncbi:galactonate dehydratase [Candidatus Bathyarchaeota archaeon]|nr:MAG: galactonate dehydratase [Candidatus Bathyarchaeota archaeon B24-2]RJS81078.1 MAG: galactonate dehydratase [Candidatus Bathyarchaeota archaeon]